MEIVFEFMELITFITSIGGIVWWFSKKNTTIEWRLQRLESICSELPTSPEVHTPDEEKSE